MNGGLFAVGEDGSSCYPYEMSIVGVPVAVALPTALEGARWFGVEGNVMNTSVEGFTLAAKATSDWFHQPTLGTQIRNAPMLLRPVSLPFRFQARLDATLEAIFDVGVLAGYAQAIVNAPSALIGASDPLA